MTIFRRHLILPVILLLALISLACQLTSAAPAAAPVNEEAIVRNAVATVEAQLPESSADEAMEEPSTTLSTPLLSLDSDLQSTLVSLYGQINPSVVHIFVFDSLEEVAVPLLGTGSGFVYDADGHIVTNNHVVASGEVFEVAFANGSRRQATIVGTDVDSDLAVIKVDSLPEGVEPIPLGDPGEVLPGQFVIAIGNPFGEMGSMSIGVISGLGRTLPSQRLAESGGRYSIPDVIQTDAAINPGNSGGPLLNLKGEVIGVNSAILTRTGTNSGVGFSVPVRAVRLIVPKLIEDGEYVYPFIGISMAPPLTLVAREELGFDQNGIYVTNVVPNTPADEAGLRGMDNNGEGGDYILAVDGQRVRDSAELISYLVFETEVDDTIELTVLRDGEEIAVPVELAPRP